MTDLWPNDATKLPPIRVTRKVPHLGRCDGHKSSGNSLRESLKRCREDAVATAAWPVRGTTDVVMNFCERHTTQLIKLHEGLGARRVIVDGESAKETTT